MSLEKYLNQDELNKKIQIKNVDKKTGARFLLRLEESQDAFKFALKKGFKHWIITFSGGKDSTTTLITALETALSNTKNIRRIDIVYADTGVEIPVIRFFALQFLDFLRTIKKISHLPIFIHVLRPSIDDSFWVCLLGKGYPPPHQRFRWCTKRLKIDPVEREFSEIIKGNDSLIVTGVRFGESKIRDKRLYQSCKRGGECGQGLWFFYSKILHAGYLAPIVNWSDCDVWDFLNFYAPTIGYPTNYLEDKVYNGRETRFGCWTCTVVKQDRAMERIIALPEWSHLRILFEFRKYIIDITTPLSSRVKRLDGNPGRLKLEVRKHLFYMLLNIEEKNNLNLLSEEEKKCIFELWKTRKYGDDRCYI